MFANFNKIGRICIKITSVVLFVFLVMFNVQIGMIHEESDDITLLGLALSVFVPDAIASEGKWADVCCGPSCSYDYCVGDGSYICCK